MAINFYVLCATRAAIIFSRVKIRAREKVNNLSSTCLLTTITLLVDASDHGGGEVVTQADIG